MSHFHGRVLRRLRGMWDFILDGGAMKYIAPIGFIVAVVVWTALIGLLVSQGANAWAALAFIVGWIVAIIVWFAYLEWREGQ